YVGEALRWLPAPGDTADSPQRSGEWSAARDTLGSTLTSDARSAGPTSARVLLADDNADMREYIARLLRSHYTVEAVPDGKRRAGRGASPSSRSGRFGHHDAEPGRIWPVAKPCAMTHACSQHRCLSCPHEQAKKPPSRACKPAPTTL